MTVKLPKDALLFVPLGGAGEIGMNLNLYGYGGKWIMVDLGMSFADAFLPGTELMFPDPSFIEKLKKDLLGIVLTHGHEDHIGAIPYLWPDLGAPLYATPFTAELIRWKLDEAGLGRKAKLHEIPLGGEFELGPFKIRYASLAHSIPEGNALVIDTPKGRIFHTGDWKLDDEPIVGHPTLPATLRKIGKEGVLAVIGDSTNIFNRRASGSEGAVRESLIELLRDKPGRVVVTTFASNVARLDTIGKVAKAEGRRLCVVGRSLDRMITVAQMNGYLADFPERLPEDEVDDLPRDKVMILCTGCQGEPRAAMARIAGGGHRHIKLSAGDTVVFSSKIIPGNELVIGRLINQLVAKELEVITEKDAFVHVSGHPGQEELQQLYGWLKPEILVPVHGELRHMTAHAAFGRQLGIKRTLVPMNGAIIRLAPDGPVLIGEAPAGRLVLDGEEIVADDSEPIADRRRMAQNGFVAAVVSIAKSGKHHPATLFIKGVPGGDDDALLAECQRAIGGALDRNAGDDDKSIAEAVRVALRRAVRNYSGKNPVTEVRLQRGKGG